MVTPKDILTFTTPETRFLSNFYPYKTKSGEKYPISVRVEYNGIEFDCVENAYQAAKLINYDDQVGFSKMTPYETKNIMDNHLRVVRPDWEQIKLTVMEGFSHAKIYEFPTTCQFTHKNRKRIVGRR